MPNNPALADHTALIPGPSFHINLAPLDALHPIHYSRRLLLFRCPSPTQHTAQLADLKTGLRCLLSRCPILGGIVVPAAVDGDDGCTIVPGEGMELIVRDLRPSMCSFGELEAAGFPPTKLPYDLLVPVPQDIGGDRPYAACKMQFSAIEGGTILAFAMSHSVADGSGTNELMRVLSEETRLAQEKSRDGSEDEGRSLVLTTHMGLDRSVLRNMTSPVEFNTAHHPAFRLETTRSSANAPQAEPAPVPPAEATPSQSETLVLLHISPAGLEQLKADAITPDGPRISTHDALAGLIWRTLVRIRCSRSAQDLPGSTTSRIYLPSDARRHLNLPQSYVGNAVYQLTASLSLATLLSPTGLQHASLALRRAITAVNPERVSSYMAKLREEWMEWGFMSMDPLIDVAMGTDWSSGQVYGEDWGQAFGPVVRFRYPDEAGVCILPKLSDGGAEIVLAVAPGEVGEVRGIGGFGKYLEVL